MCRSNQQRKRVLAAVVQGGLSQVYDTVALVARLDITLVYARRTQKQIMNWILSSFNRLFSLWCWYLTQNLKQGGKVFPLLVCSPCYALTLRVIQYQASTLEASLNIFKYYSLKVGGFKGKKELSLSDIVNISLDKDLKFLTI